MPTTRLRDMYVRKITRSNYLSHNALWRLQAPSPRLLKLALALHWSSATPLPEEELCPFELCGGGHSARC